MDETSKKAFEITKHIKESTAETLENVRSGGLTGQLRSQIGQLQAENEQIKRQFDCLSELVIYLHPETWECYLEDVKKILKELNEPETKKS